MNFCVASWLHSSYIFLMIYIYIYIFNDGNGELQSIFTIITTFLQVPTCTNIYILNSIIITSIDI